MSAGVQRREVARRVFAAEFDLADESLRVGDGDRAPTYVVSPGGAWMNRIFTVGVLTEQADVSSGEMIRARIADPTGAVVTYAGQYQPSAAARLEQANVGTMLALTGKARTYQPDDGDATYTSIRPETVTVVDGGTQQQWIVDTALATLQRIDLLAGLSAAGLPSVDVEDIAAGDTLDDRVIGAVAALHRYAPGLGFLEQLRELSVEALELVSGDRDAVSEVQLSVSAEASGLGPIPPAARSPIDVESAIEAITSLADHSPGSGVSPPADPAGTGVVASTAQVDDPTAPADSTDMSGESSQAVTSPVSADIDSSDQSEQSTHDEPTSPVEGTSATESPTAADVSTSPPPAEELEPTDASPSPQPADGSEAADDSGTAHPPHEGAESPPDQADIEAEVQELGEFELGEETRAALEEEFDTGFTTGAELDRVDSTAESEITPSADDPVELVVAAMNTLDDGDGAPTAAVIDHVTAAADMDRPAVEAAIEEALMGGRCYEPAEGRLTAI
jgi:RPA family protein